MLLTVFCVRRDRSEVTFSMEVSPELELRDFIALCELESGIPAAEIQITYAEQPLGDTARALATYGLKDGDVVVLRQADRPPSVQPAFPGLPRIDFSSIAVPGTSTGRRPTPAAMQQQRSPPPPPPPTLQPGSSSASSPQGLDDPALLRDMLLANPHELSLLKERNPPLAEALLSGDLERFTKVLLEQQQERARREQERIRLLTADPFDLEAQAKIEEDIRQHNIEENMTIAMEEAPESFGQVVMLYINCKVNGHPVKAFVDSGAQMTIMSQACAERCNIMRLVDRRWAGIAKGVGTQKIIGRVHLAQVQIEGDFLPCSFSILEDQPMDMLLGLDMLKRHQCSIDLKKNVLLIGTTGSETRFLPEAELPECARLAYGPGREDTQPDEIADRELAEALQRSVQETDIEDGQTTSPTSPPFPQPVALPNSSSSSSSSRSLPPAAPPLSQTLDCSTPTLASLPPDSARPAQVSQDLSEGGSEPLSPSGRGWGPESPPGPGLLVSQDPNPESDQKPSAPQLTSALGAEVASPSSSSSPSVLPRPSSPDTSGFGPELSPAAGGAVWSPPPPSGFPRDAPHPLSAMGARLPEDVQLADNNTLSSMQVDTRAGEEAEGEGESEQHPCPPGEAGGAEEAAGAEKVPGSREREGDVEGPGTTQHDPDPRQHDPDLEQHLHLDSDLDFDLGTEGVGRIAPQSLEESASLASCFECTGGKMGMGRETPPSSSPSSSSASAGLPPASDYAIETLPPEELMDTTPSLAAALLELHELLVASSHRSAVPSPSPPPPPTPPPRGEDEPWGMPSSQMPSLGGEGGDTVFISPPLLPSVSLQGLDNTEMEREREMEREVDREGEMEMESGGEREGEMEVDREGEMEMEREQVTETEREREGESRRVEEMEREREMESQEPPRVPPLTSEHKDLGAPSGDTAAPPPAPSIPLHSPTTVSDTEALPVCHPRPFPPPVVPNEVRLPDSLLHITRAGFSLAEAAEALERFHGNAELALLVLLARKITVPS
ncbi:protein DDI1 homolog 2 isoform X1 [Amia ocellicauda]|uniref:protein DDI1 homolog 2 isoform X1 n=1 Tax=Amia ocellicauda TaxID=2972642 RepID=UPI00346424EF